MKRELRFTSFFSIFIMILNTTLLPSQQLMVGFKFLASGSFQQVVDYTIKVHRRTVSRAITRVTRAILKLRKEFVYWPIPEECTVIALETYEQNDFPYVERV